MPAHHEVVSRTPGWPGSATASHRGTPMSYAADWNETSASDDDAPEYDATASGIVQCLIMLAEEAAALKLSRTLDALRDALEICRVESKPAGPALVLH